MEYKIYKYLRHHIKIPFFIRFIFWVFLIFISSIPLILPIFPWSIVPWVLFLIVWILLIVPGHKIKHVVKIRKWILYLAKNFHNKHIIKHKMKDIKSHVKNILKNK